MKFSKFVLIFVLTLTLVFGSNLAVYAFEIIVPISSYQDAGMVNATVTEEEGVYTAHLNAVPYPGYRFYNWMFTLNNTAYYLSNEPEYDFILVNDMEILPQFNRVHTMNVTTEGTGNYVIAAPHDGLPLSGEYASGENIVITPLPGEDYHFSAWTYNDNTVNYTNPIAFTMPSDDVDIRLVFSRDSFMLTGNVSPVNSGTIYYVGNYLAGDVITLNANPDSGYSFVNWEYGSEVVDPVIVDNEMTFTMPNQDTVISANFIPNATVTATVKYVDSKGISIQDDEQIEIPIGPYNQTAPAISGYLSIYSFGNVGTLFPFEDPIVITHVYMPLQATTEPTTESTIEPTTESTTESTTGSTTEPTNESTTGSTTEPTNESTTGSTTGLTNESTTGSTTEPTNESTTESATIPVSVFITIPTSVPSTGPSTEFIIESTAESTTDAPSESTTESTADSTIESTIESTTESTAESTTEIVFEIISEEEVPLGLPVELVEVPEIIGETTTQTTNESEEIILDEDVPLATALPQTRFLPFLILLGISSLIIFTIMWIKSRR